jgi:hypothetical protein
MALQRMHSNHSQHEYPLNRNPKNTNKKQKKLTAKFEKISTHSSIKSAKK